MKKKFKSSFVVVLLTLLFSGSMVVNAQTSDFDGYIYQGEQIDGIYFYKHREDTDNIKYPTHNFYEQATIYRRSTDKKAVYCIESWKQLKGASVGDYKVSSSFEDSNLTEEQNKKINIISYYGYGYKEGKYNHTDKKWYAITQYMIWQIQAPEIEHYFVASLNSKTPIYPFEEEIAEMNKLIKEHEIVPKFDYNKTITVGDVLILHDQNKVLPKFVITGINHKLVDLNREDDYTIKIRAKTIGNNTLHLYKNSKKEFNKYYISEDFQNAALLGNYGNVHYSMTVFIKGGTIHIKKQGEKLSSYEDGRFIYNYENIKGTTFSLYAESEIKNNIGEILYKKDELIDTINTDEKDNFTNLPFGKYYVKEISSIYPYVIEDKKYLVDLSKDNPNITLEIKNNYQDTKISFNKYQEYCLFEDSELVCQNKLEPNIEFGLYNENDILNDKGELIVKKDSLIKSSFSDESGSITFDLHLPYGNYYIKELTENDLYEANYLKTHFEIKLVSNNLKTNLQLDDWYNIQKKTKVIINKTNEEGEFLSNVEYAFYDINSNFLFTKRTDEFGQIELLLPYGEYYYEETETLANYILDSTIYHLNVDSKEDIIINLINRHEEEKITTIEVEVPKTDKFSKLPFFGLLTLLISSFGIFYVKE